MLNNAKGFSLISHFTGLLASFLSVPFIWHDNI